MKNLLVPYKSQWDADGTMTANDCGPASIAMILAYYGQPVTINEVFKATDADTGLISWPELQKAISSFGYKANLERKQNLDRIKALIDQDKPVIILGHYGSLKSQQDKKFKGGHFMLVVGYHNDGFFVNDPNFKTPLRQDGDHHNYTTQEIQSFWADATKDGNQAFSLLWIERKSVPVPTNPENDDYQRAINIIKAYRSVRQQGPEGSWEGYANALVGHDGDVIRLQQDLVNAQIHINELEARIMHEIQEKLEVNQLAERLNTEIIELTDKLKQNEKVEPMPMPVTDPNVEIKKLPTNMLIAEIFNRFLGRSKGGEGNEQDARSGK